MNRRWLSRSWSDRIGSPFLSFARRECWPHLRACTEHRPFFLLPLPILRGLGWFHTARVGRAPPLISQCDHNLGARAASTETNPVLSDLLYPPSSANLNIRSIHVAGFVTEEITDCTDCIVNCPDVAGGNTFGHGGQFAWRCAT